MGRPPAALAGPDLPEGLEHLWGWFRELDAARASNGFSLEPISYGELAAWVALSGHRPSGFEFECLRALDQLVLQFQAEQQRKRRKR